MSKCHCGKHASFNSLGETKGRFCSKHKEINMVDVTHKTCEEAGCNIRPTYNISGGKARFCEEHKHTNMVNVLYKT